MCRAIAVVVISVCAGLGGCAQDRACDDDGVANGSFVIASDADLAALAGCTTVTGSLSVGSPASFIGPFELTSPGPTTLVGLESLAVVGSLIIQNTVDLHDLQGLEGLGSVPGVLDIERNESLTSVAGLNALTTVGELLVVSNPSLGGLGDLSSLTTLTGVVIVNVGPLRQLRIVDNPQLPQCEVERLATRLLIPCNNGGQCADNQASLTNVTLSSVDDMALIAGKTCISGDLEIVGGSLTTLTGLEELESIGGGLFIRTNPSLVDVAGLERLSSVGVGASVEIDDNPALTTLGGLQNLDLAAGSSVRIANNAALASLDGLGRISVLLSLTIRGNNALTNLAGLEGLISVGGSIFFGTAGGLEIADNPSLTSLEGLSGLTSVTALLIASNPGLINLEGVPRLVAVDSLTLQANGALTSLDGLPASITIGSARVVDGLVGPRSGGLAIFDNPVLADLDALLGITELGHLDVRGNPALANLDGLGDLRRLEKLVLSNNATLADVDGLDDVRAISGSVFIGGNAALASLAGLGLVTSMGPLQISGRALEAVGPGTGVLTSLAGLEQLTSVGGEFVVGQLTIDHNPALSNIDALAGLQVMTGAFPQIHDNPALPQCDVDALVARFAGSVCTCGDNLASCPSRATLAFSRVDVAAGPRPKVVAMGDFNLDGRADLALLDGFDPAFSVRFNNTAPATQTPGFAANVAFATGEQPGALVVADVDADGRPDIAVARFATDSLVVSVHLNATEPGALAPSFGAPFDLPVTTLRRQGLGLTVADLSGDGRPDFAVVNGVDSVSVLFNETVAAGTPSFASSLEFATATGPRAVATGDLNGDGKLDLAVATSVGVSLLFNVSEGATPAFAPHVDVDLGLERLAIAVGDVDGDGRPDIATANTFDDTLTILFNGTPAGATTPTFASGIDRGVGDGPVAVAIVDVDGDERLDLVAVIEHANTVSIFQNNAAPLFGASLDFATGTTPLSVAVGDLNGDGAPELVVPNADSSTFSVLVNE